MSPFTVPESIGKYLSLVGKGAIPLLILSLGYSINRTSLHDLRHGLAEKPIHD